MARQRRHAPPRKRRGRFRLIYKILSIILVIAAILVACVAFFRVNRIETTGNAHYTSEEIIEASGIQIGENLMTLPTSKIASSIRTQLPYIEGVSIQRILPDGVLLKVTERAAAASVDSAEGRWLISAQGKLLETATENTQVLAISGLSVLAPYAGGMVQVAEEHSNTLNYVLELLSELENHGILNQCTALDCSQPTYMMLSYDLYRIKLPRGVDYDYYIRLALRALDQGRSSGTIPEGQGGTLDLTVKEGEAYFKRGG